MTIPNTAPKNHFRAMLGIPRPSALGVNTFLGSIHPCRLLQNSPEKPASAIVTISPGPTGTWGVAPNGNWAHNTGVLEVTLLDAGGFPVVGGNPLPNTCVALEINSPDINGDLIVNVADALGFALLEHGEHEV